MNKQKSWREKINDIMENYRLYEEGSGSANWDDKYTKQIVKVVGQAISSERQRLIKEVKEKVKKVMDEYEDNYFGSYIKKKILDQIKST